LLKHPPDALFIGGDILPHGYHIGRKKPGDFIQDELVRRFLHLKEKLGKRYPRVFLIMGNDDPRINEERIIQLGEKYDIWEYAHGRHLQFGSFDIYGYSFIPPSPFGLKDWEKYDVSRFADPGCTHPIQGIRGKEAISVCFFVSFTPL
jgi:Icc-related predicted phosphoesterase